MFCHRCGKGLPDDAVFCNQCGTKVAAPGQSSPSPQGKVTIQFDSNSQTLPPQQGVGQPLPPTQFDQYAQGTLPPFGNGPGSAQYPPILYGSNPQLPPTQFGSSPQYPPIQYGSNPQLPPTQFGNTPSPAQYPSSWQIPAPSAALPDISPTIYGQPASSAAPTMYGRSEVPPNATQRLLVRTFGANLASNALFGVILGGLLAAVVGLLSTALLLSIAHATVPHLPGSSYFNNQDIIDYALGIVPLHNGFRDSMQLLLVMHGIGQHIQFTNGSYSYYAPLNGLLILPALLITWAGYVAASTDYQNRVQSSLWRGVAVAIPYTLILFLMVSQVNGCMPIPGSGQDNTATICTLSPSSSANLLSMDNLSLLLFGLLWGSLFGLLGASIKLGRGQWRHMLRQYLRTSARPQIMGMITGGLAASGLGIALSLLVVFSFIVYTSYSLPLLQRYACLPGSDWQTLTAWAIVQGPLYAVNLFLLSFGTPINFNNTLPSTCYFFGSAHTSISLFGTVPQLSSWTHLLLAIPVLSLFLGGRASAAIARVQGTGPAAIQGAIIALPFTVLMALLTTISSITLTYSSTANISAGNGLPMTAGASVLDLILWGLLSGAVVGALGGIYQISTIKISVSRFLAALILSLAAITGPIYLILDRLTGHPTNVQRSQSRNLLYAALLCTFLLGVAAALAGGSLIMYGKSFTLDDNQHIRDIVSVLLVALPGLLLLGVCASALARDPQLDRPIQTASFATL